MYSMFQEATKFNQYIGGWNTSSETSMGAMFQDAISFNQDIGGWDTSSVVNIYSMLQEATSFNQDLSSWCVTNIGSEPTEFAINSPLEELNKLIWRTCP